MVGKIKVTKVDLVDKKSEAINTPSIEKKKINFEYLAFLTIGAVVFLMPLFFLPVSILGLTQAKLTLLVLGTLLAFCFLVVDRMKKGTITLSLNPIHIIAVLIAITYFVSGWTGVSQYKSLIGSMTEQDTFITVFIGFVFLFVLSQVTKNTKKIFMILSLLFGSIAIAMVSQVVRIFFGYRLFALGVLDNPVTTLVGSWGDITILSLILLSVFVIVLETVKLKKWVMILSYIFLIIPFIFVVLSGLSFDFYFFNVGLLLLIAVASIIIFAYLFSLRRTHKSVEDVENIITKKKSTISASLVILFISILLVLFGSQLNVYLSGVTGVNYVEGRPNWQSTIDVASKVLAQKPLFGSGPNTFDIEWNLNRSVEVNNYIFWNNQYNFGVGFVPTSLVTVGGIGFILWILFYVFVFILGFRTLFGLDKRQEVTIVNIIISIGAILSSIVMIFYTPGIVVVFANLVFVALLGILNAHNFRVININLYSKQWKNFLSTIGFVIALIFAIYLMYLVAFKALGNMYYRKAVLSTDVNVALSLIQKSISLDPTQPLYYQTKAQIYATKVATITSLSQTEIVEKKNEIDSNIANAIDAAIFAEQINQMDYNSKIVTGKILEFFGSLGLKDASRGSIQKYLAANMNAPTNPLPLLFASNVALSINDKNSAKDYLTRAIMLKSDYSDVPELAKEIRTLVEQINKSTASSAATTINGPASEQKTKAKEKTK